MHMDNIEDNIFFKNNQQHNILPTLCFKKIEKLDKP